MRKFRRWLLVGLILTVPVAAGACTFDLGNGCRLSIMEPGVQFGVTCNPF